MYVVYHNGEVKFQISGKFDELAESAAMSYDEGNETCMQFDESLFETLKRSHPGFMIRAEFDSGSEERLIIVMAGYLDANNSGAFTDAMNSVIDTYPALKLIVFDLERLNYISSTGIGAFANVLIRAKQKGIRLSLVKLGQNVRAVFDVLGISGFFSIAANLTQALSGGPSPKYDLENEA